MKNDLYYLVLEALLDEAELNEFSGAGAIGGVATPLGSGPSGKVVYRSGKSSSKSAYKSKTKKKKRTSKLKKTMSPSWYIKNGPAKPSKKLQEQNATKCLTSGAQFHISVNPKNIGVNVDLPFYLDLNERQAIEMETLLHNAIELVLSRYWN